MPDPDAASKPESLNWDLWLGPAHTNHIHLTCIPSIGEDGGIMELGH